MRLRVRREVGRPGASPMQPHGPTRARPCPRAVCDHLLVARRHGPRSPGDRQRKPCPAATTPPPPALSAPPAAPAHARVAMLALGVPGQATLRAGSPRRPSGASLLQLLAHVRGARSVWVPPWPAPPRRQPWARAAAAVGAPAGACASTLLPAPPRASCVHGFSRARPQAPAPRACTWPPLRTGHPPPTARAAPSRAATPRTARTSACFATQTAPCAASATRCRRRPRCLRT